MASFGASQDVLLAFHCRFPCNLTYYGGAAEQPWSGMRGRWPRVPGVKPQLSGCIRAVFRGGGGGGGGGGVKRCHVFAGSGTEAASFTCFGAFMGAFDFLLSATTTKIQIQMAMPSLCSCSLDHFENQRFFLYTFWEHTSEKKKRISVIPRQSPGASV